MTLKILCPKCQKYRPAKAFAQRRLGQEDTMCIACEGGKVKMFLYGIQAESKIRKCINCGRQFESINDLRLCADCKRNW